MADSTQTIMPPPPPGFSGGGTLGAATPAPAAPPPPDGYSGGGTLSSDTSTLQSGLAGGIAAAKEAAITDPGVQTAIGGAKGVAESFLGGSELMNKVLRSDYGPLAIPRLIPGVKQQLDKWIPEMGHPDDYVKAATGDPNATLEAHGVGQNVGKIGETLSEFLVGEGELKALTFPDRVAATAKAAKLLEQYPRLARIAEAALRIGGNAVVGGTTAGAENLVKTGGENPAESLKSGAEVGGAGAALETLGAVAKPLAEKGFNYLNSKGAIRALNVDALKEGFFPNANLAGTELSSAVQKDLDTVEKQLMGNYGSQLASMGQTADAAGITVGASGSPLAQKAGELLDEGGKLPKELQGALKAARQPGLERVEPLLKELGAGKPLTWDEAVDLRRKLGNAAYHADNQDPAKQVFNQLRNALDDSLEKGAQDADKPELADSLRALRADYAETISTLQKNAVVKGLANKDYDTVAAALMRNNTVAGNVGTLRGLLNRIGSTNMDSVEASIFDKLSSKSTVTNGTESVVDAKKFIQNFRNIPEDVREAIWGDKAAKIDEILSKGSQETLQPQADITKRIAGQAFGLHGAAGVALGGAMWSAYHGNWKAASEALASALALEGLKNPKVQKAVLTGLQYISTASEQNPLKGAGSQIRERLGEAGEAAGNAVGGPLIAGLPNPPNERTISPEIDDLIKKAGGIPGGLQKGDPEIGLQDLALFHDPTSGSTLALPMDKVSKEAVAKRLADSQQEFLKAQPKP